MNIKHILISLLIIFFGACKSKKNDGFDAPFSTDLVKNGASANDTNNGDKPEITFEKMEHDFGTIKEGEKVSFQFKFKNTGKTDLIIGDAKGSCGCTVPKYPTHPIEPGDTGVIDVEFNSMGKHGKQNKNVTLITNASPSTRVLTIIGDVVSLK